LLPRSKCKAGWEESLVQRRSEVSRGKAFDDLVGQGESCQRPIGSHRDHSLATDNYLYLLYFTDSLPDLIIELARHAPSIANETSMNLDSMAKHIELWLIDKLIPWARNPRTHSDAQIGQIAASIVEFGFNNPILVDTKAGIIAGHGRLLAAR